MDPENTTQADKPASKPERGNSASAQPGELVRKEMIVERIIGWCAHNQFLVLVAVLFLIVAGIISVKRVRLDAIPDLSDVQVVVFTEWPGRDPQLVEDQITYPIVSALASAPSVKYVRGQTFFGLSFVNVIFEDGTDMYWARSRVLEYLNQVTGDLPPGISPTLGPDATGVGWIFEYALVDETGQNSLADLRTLQDWTLRYYLQNTPGVAEVASVGGFVREYQVDVDPNKLLAYHIPLPKLVAAIRDSNNDVGGRVLEFGETEYMVKGVGYITSLEDIEKVVIGVDTNGTPITVKQVANVHFGPDMRRGVLDLDGRGEAVGGIVVMRYGEDALKTINAVKAKLEAFESSLPPGVKIVTGYDRSELILRAINNLKKTLIEESLIVALIVMLFLFHIRSALVAILVLPMAILLSFIAMVALGVSSNIMSLGGIAIAIGVMLDAAVVMIENAHKWLERWNHARAKRDQEGDPALTPAEREIANMTRLDVVVAAAKQVGRPLFFSLLIITEAKDILQKQDALLASHPEVERVYGKIGRARSATDSAPLSMTETVVTLKPEDQWRPGMTFDKIKDELDQLVRTPGAPAIWWMPIQTRIEMMATGIRSEIGIKVLGPDLAVIQQVAEQIEGVLKNDPNTATVFAERVTGGYYVDFNINRDQVARYGLTVGDVQTIIESAIGGKTISWTVEGRERYPINVRYARDHREDLPALRRVLVPTPTGAQVPMEQLADIQLRTGPPAIRDENGMLAGFVFVDTKNTDLGTYVNRAKKLIADNVELPPGYFLSWGGQYQYMLKARETLKLVIPLTLVIIFVLLYLNFNNVTEALIVLLSIPFALVGGIWLVWLLDYNFSVAVAVGFIALAGVAAETGVVMIVYLDDAWNQLLKSTAKPTLDGLYQSVKEGAVQRVRPVMMTVCSTIAGLLPIMWSHGAGALTMKRIAAPMVGGMITATILTLIIIPVIYFLWRSRGVEAPPVEAKPVRKLLTASIIMGALVLGGGGWWLWHDLSGPSQPTAVVSTQTVGPYQIEILGESAQLRMGDNAIRIEVTDATGEPVDVGSVWLDLSLDMPGMPMRAAAQLEKGDAPGVFTGTIQPSGQGEWHASIGYENRKGKDSASFTTSVGP